MENILVTNKVSVSTNNTFIPIPPGEFSRPIQFKEELAIQNAAVFDVNEQGQKMTRQNLLDLSTINNIDGTPTGVPANDGMRLNQFNLYRNSWYNVDYDLIFDLDGLYNLDYAYVWVPFNNNYNITLFGSEDGTTFNQFAQLVADQNKWVRIDFPTILKGGNRYFKIRFDYENFWIKGLVLYGRPVGTQVLNHGVKKRRQIIKRHVDEAMGTNAFMFENPLMMQPVSGYHRFYVNTDWFMGDAYRNVGTAIGKTVDQINFKFDSSHMGSMDQLLQGFKNTGTKVMFDTINSPVAFRAISVNDPGATKALDPGFSTHNLAHTTNPLNYTFIARTAWNIAARYGANRNVDTRFIQLQQAPLTQPIRVGLDLIHCMEIGNEMDKWWVGENGYHNPQEMAAYMSAHYDGHMGQMGPGFGIKNADPSMIVSLVSLALGDNYSYVREIMLWCDKYRGKGNYPWDVVNYHWYNSNEGSQTVGSETGAHGIQPELGDLMLVNKNWSNLRDRFNQGMQVWLTEAGYDEHLGGVYAPAKPTQFERSRLKAYWLCRLYMCGQISGVDVLHQYWYANQGGIRFTDQDPFTFYPDKFRSSGLTDGVQSSDDFNRFPLMSYWYVAAFKSTLTNYQFSHLVMRNGIQYTDDMIIKTSNPHIWATAYKNYITNQSIIAIWLDTDDFVTLEVEVMVSESNVTVYTIEDAEIRESIDPISTILPATNGLIKLTIGECPRFINTVNINVGALIQPTNIQTQRIKGTNNLITWTDDNLDNITIRISRSKTQIGGYAVIYQAINADAFWVDQTVGANTAYFYRVTAVRDNAVIPPSEPENPDEPTPGDELWRSNFEHAYTADRAYNISGTLAAEGEEVVEFKDWIGTLHMPYDGVPDPLLSHARPRKHTQLNGLVRFPNETGILYRTDFEANTYPRERWFVFTMADYFIYEAWFNVYNAEYLGDRGPYNIRLKNGGADPADESYHTDVPRLSNKTHIIRQVFRDTNSNPNLIDCEMWLDGLKINKALTTYRSNQHVLAVGADTNSSHFGLHGLWYRNSIMDQTKADAVMAELITYYKVGQALPVPYAENIKITTLGTVVTLTYDYKPYNNIGEDTTKRIVRWIYVYAGITFSIYMPELDGKMSFDAALYPQYDLFNKEIRVEVTVFNTAGISFVIPQSLETKLS